MAHECGLIGDFDKRILARKQKSRGELNSPRLFYGRNTA